MLNNKGLQDLLENDPVLKKCYALLRILDGSVEVVPKDCHDCHFIRKDGGWQCSIGVPSRWHKHPDKASCGVHDWRERARKEFAEFIGAYWTGKKALSTLDELFDLLGRKRAA